MVNAEIPSNEKLEHLPASSWVRFLRSYGPASNNLTMFDDMCPVL
jgi:hypothetical protein